MDGLAAQDPVTLLLLGINVAISLWAFSRASSGSARSGWPSPSRPAPWGGPPGEEFLFVPAQVRRGRNLSGMLLSQFSHGDVAHLLFNLITLYFFGPVVERWLGPGPLVLIYVAAAVGSTLLTFAVHRDDPGYRALGASGAISGVLFAAIVLEPGMGIRLFMLPFDIPAPIFAIGYVLVSIWAARRRLGNIGHEAHLGGAITGLLLAGGLSPDGYGPLLARLRDMVS